MREIKRYENYMQIFLSLCKYFKCFLLREEERDRNRGRERKREREIRREERERDRG